MPPAASAILLATTIGFSALDGLMLGTRGDAMDPAR